MGFMYIYLLSEYCKAAEENVVLFRAGGGGGEKH